MFILPNERELENRQAREIFRLAAQTPEPGMSGTTEPPNAQLVPIGTRCRVAGMFGVIVGYNDRQGGFYPAERYPYVVRREDGYQDVYGFQYETECNRLITD